MGGGGGRTTHFDQFKGDILSISGGGKLNV